MRSCEVRRLGRMEYAEAFRLQQDLVARRKAGLIPDQFLLLEHSHTITLGRNGRLENLLAHERILERGGIAFHHCDRGGDITYHGPGQVIGYPILDLRDWKRDVSAYARALEQVQMDALADFGIASGRVPGCTGVWVEGRKIGAIGVHLSRWVTSHGFALNVNTDLTYFQYIVPCGLAKPVTSMAQLGSNADCERVMTRLTEHFGRIFGLEVRLVLEADYDRRSDAPNGRKHRGRDVDEVAEEAGRANRAG
ncbi:MAG: lipoyl(octanoyl) transferase LipB [Bryobacteraceae bacterium]